MPYDPRPSAADADLFDVAAAMRNLKEAVRHHKMLVLATVVLTVALAAAYHIVWPPVYEAKTSLVGERDSDYSRDAFYASWSVFRKDDQRTEIELMTSAKVLKEVIDREHLTYDDVYHPFMSHVAYLWEKSLVGRTYRKVKGWALGPEDFGMSEADRALARTIVDMREGISIEPVGDTNVDKIGVRGPLRKVAAIANTLAEAYLRQRSERHAAEARRSVEVLGTEVDKADDVVRKIEEDRLAFLTKHDLILDLQMEGVEIGKLADLDSSVANTRTKVATLEANLKALDAQLKNEPATKTTAVVTELNSTHEAVRQRRLDLQMNLVTLRDRYREDSPEVREVQADLVKLDDLYGKQAEWIDKTKTVGINIVQEDLASKRAAVVSDLEGSRAGLTVVEGEAKTLRTHLAEVPALQTALRTLDRNLGAATDKYHAMLNKRAQAMVSLTTMDSAMPSLSIVDRAMIPANKYWPKVKILYPAAVGIGLILGVCVALIRSATDGRVRRRHVEQFGGAAPHYGTIVVSTHGRPLSARRTPVSSTPSPQRDAHER